ncbi:sulfotransferase [Cognatiyoonia sp. IB215182]|uniref:sulfotransferase n=1 Tax=Cognatiyoonia sp. IB215182 TaxID=3097353 RepID=UPI002A168D5F|nr:sulfotransferase [Cognatiyoonia sp. IB215182]MDX8354936.1 sulfotransferase [Cognatiyoonia sp. IB215182]
MAEPVQNRLRIFVGSGADPMANGQELTIDQAYKQALEHYNKGAFRPAVTLFSKIIKAAPQHAHAHQMLGLIAFQTGQLEPAKKAMAEALRLRPDNAGFLVNFTEILRKAGDLAEAIAVGKRAVAGDPNNPAAHSNLGLAQYDSGDLVAAEANQKRALALDPDFGAALNNLGSIARDNGDQEAAIAYYRAALAANPHYAETANNLTAALIEVEAYDQAKAVTADRLKRAPKDADLQRNVGRLHMIDSKLDEAETAFRNAISLDENKTEGYIGLAQVLFEKNHPKLSLIEAETALRLDPESAMAHHQIAMVKAHLGDIDAGFAGYRKALELKPDLTASQIALGHLEMEQGNFDAAKATFTAAMDSRDPLSAQVALARLEKMTDDHPILRALEEARPTASSMPPAKAVAYHYALGKALEDVKRFDEAFTHFAEGAAIKRSIITYDADEADRAVTNIIETFDADFIGKLRNHAIASTQPIFVVGMPRSGTTLTESILNAHPRVFGAGELNDLNALFGAASNGQRVDLASNVAGMTGADLTRKITTYVANLDAHAPGTPHIVDKMPANFQMVGLIHGLLPNAKIVHIARNPFDTCLSCFTRVFERSQLHSYDQVELGRYFNNYVRLMDHWQATLPEGAFHTLHYENLVDDIDKEARGLIAHCGLEWDDACLAFYKGKRRVRTASVQQVRQPLYASSKDKWKRYERQLQPLVQTIGDIRITA